MPINASPEYFAAEQRYLEAKTKEEKIEALEDMIRLAPSHKGGEKLRMELKQRLAKLKAQKEAKTGRKSLTIPKKGDAQVSIIGFTQSGKSVLLSKLTNARPEISTHAFTTQKPEVGTLDYYGVKIQLVEIPSTFEPVFMSIAQSSDGLVLVVRNPGEEKELEDLLKQFRIKKSFVVVNKYDKLEEIKEKIWKILGLIRIYTKEPGKKAERKPLVLKENSTVKDAAKNLHKDFLKYFKFARVWGSSKYAGEKIGLDYKLKDKDILEFHLT